MKIIELVDPDLYVNLLAKLDRKHGQFYVVVLSHAFKEAIVLPIDDAENWKQAEAYTKALLHMMDAVLRCSAGWTDYGLPENMKHMEAEIPHYVEFLKQYERSVSFVSNN
jgi:hypothetical protein